MFFPEQNWPLRGLPYVLLLVYLPFSFRTLMVRDIQPHLCACYFAAWLRLKYRVITSISSSLKNPRYSFAGAVTAAEGSSFPSMRRGLILPPAAILQDAGGYGLGS